MSFIASPIECSQSTNYGVHEGSVANLAKKPRKGRSDKGVPRGPRGPNIRSKYK